MVLAELGLAACGLSLAAASRGCVSCSGAGLPLAVASLVAEQAQVPRLQSLQLAASLAWHSGLWALGALVIRCVGSDVLPHVESSRARDQTHVLP